MKVSTKIICLTAGFAGAILLGGIAAVLLMKRCKGLRICKDSSCDHAEETMAETEKDIPMQETCTEETKCSEE